MIEYALDTGQRNVLFWDVMRQRGDQYREHLEEAAPHVLHYQVELVMDGRKLERPVNYALARVIPPPGIEIEYRPTSGSDHGNLTADQIDRQHWQPIIVTLRPSVLNGKVPPLDIAGLFETFMERRD
jgi:hypothetical protein